MILPCNTCPRLSEETSLFTQSDISTDYNKKRSRHSLSLRYPIHDRVMKESWPHRLPPAVRLASSHHWSYSFEHQADSLHKIVSIWQYKPVITETSADKDIQPVIEWSWDTHKNGMKHARACTSSVLCLQDRAAIRSGPAIGLLSLFAQRLPQWVIRRLSACTRVPHSEGTSMRHVPGYRHKKGLRDSRE